MIFMSSVVFVIVSAATTYYVSPSGSDANSGTDSRQPWATLARVGIAAPTTGLTVLLARNATWFNDPLVISCSPGGVLTIGSYGDASLPHPLLQHARGLSDPAIGCIEIATTTFSSTTISGLHFSGCGTGVSLVGNASAATPASNVLISANVFQDIRTPFMHYAPPNPAWASAVELRGGHLRNVTVANNVGVRIDVFFRSSSRVDTLTLDANTVQQCSGNCYSFGAGANLTMSNSVLLRDVSTRLFMYGTTDVIIGTLSGSGNALLNNDFNSRGEYQGGPDGCAFDFETSATGFRVEGNAFSQSWGAGIMIFGHESTSHDVVIARNVFDRAGCVQNRGDRGAIAVMCPNRQKPSGLISENVFFTTEGCPAIAYAFAGCDANLNQTGNRVWDYHDQHAAKLVAMPQLSFNPPPPTTTATFGKLDAVAVTATEGATIRYTLDGSRPTEGSLLMPAAGLQLPWPGPAVNVNVRAFKAGMTPSITNGAMVELNYILGRKAPHGPYGPGGARVGSLGGTLDGFRPQTRVATGWAVDSALAGEGLGPVTVLLSVDGSPAASILADEARPDLVKAGVAPNADHGFSVTLPEAATKTLLSGGRHVLSARALGSPSTVVPRSLPGRSEIVCEAGLCRA